MLRSYCRYKYPEISVAEVQASRSTSRMVAYSSEFWESRSKAWSVPPSRMRTTSTRTNGTTECSASDLLFSQTSPLLVSVPDSTVGAIAKEK